MLDVLCLMGLPMGALPIFGATICAGEYRIWNGCNVQVYSQSYKEEGTSKHGCKESWVHLLQVF
jgi:hypothetical protein